MRYSRDGFARFVGGAVKIARPEADVDTREDFGYVTLASGQVFRFSVQEVDPGDAAVVVASLRDGED